MKAVVADITKLRVEAVVNAANGRGPMGSGVAGALRRAAGQSVQDEVMGICRANGYYKEGDCYISSAGDLGKNGVTAIYHCVTMEYPGSRSSLDTVGKAMRKTLEAAVANGVKSIAFPGLGTGIGALNPKSVASLMVRTAKGFSDKIEVTFVDIEPVFITAVEQAIQAGESNGEEQAEGDRTRP